MEDILIHVTGEVSSQEIDSAQDALRRHEPYPGVQVSLIPEELGLAFDWDLALSAVSTLTGVATFVMGITQGRKARERGKASVSHGAGQNAPAPNQPTGVAVHGIETGASRVVVRSDDRTGGTTEWTLEFWHQDGTGHIVAVN